MSLRFAIGTDTGLLRDGNEDSARVVPELDLFVVADGMGGHVGGEVASRVAADSFAEVVAAQADAKLVRDQPPVLERAILSANDSVMREGATRGLFGMGTTLTAARVTRRTGTFAHVGDSRAYLLEPGKLRQLSRDHTLVAGLVELGTLTREQAAEHPERHMLIQAIGTDYEIQPDVFQQRLPRKGRILLCSDGLHDQVPEPEILRLGEHADLEHAVADLVSAANAAGGIDNVTVVLVDISVEP